VQAFPMAKVIGIDSSPAMIAKAKTAVPHAHFQQADLASWTPDAAADLLFSNATFQWLPQHLTLLQGYLQIMKQGAVLALQMPDNLNEPSHVSMRDLARAGPWAESLKLADRSPLLSPQDYYTALKPHATTLDIWHTIYNHPLKGLDAIIAWLSATGLKPYLDPLPQQQQAVFIEEYRHRLANSYAVDKEGITLLRFPRLFIVATR
jgi:trans-aconitate 2-methyltransferase